MSSLFNHSTFVSLYSEPAQAHTHKSKLKMWVILSIDNAWFHLTSDTSSSFFYEFTAKCVSLSLYFMAWPEKKSVIWKLSPKLLAACFFSLVRDDRNGGEICVWAATSNTLPVSLVRSLSLSLSTIQLLTHHSQIALSLVKSNSVGDSATWTYRVIPSVIVMLYIRAG